MIKFKKMLSFLKKTRARLRIWKNYCIFARFLCYDRVY